MSVYKSKFQPIMERWSLVLKIVLLTTGLMFLLRTFMLQSLQDQIASLLLGIILVSIYIYMLIVIPSFIFLGYIGVMGSTHYGKYYSYVKNPNQQIFILTEKKNYLLSCENRDMFIKDLLIHL